LVHGIAPYAQAMYATYDTYNLTKETTTFGSFAGPQLDTVLGPLIG
jgi:hypothetical protein